MIHDNKKGDEHLYSINQAAYQKAVSLINQGKITEKPWSKPSLTSFGGDIKEYASYHLAKDPDGAPDKAGTYHYPYGKGGLVYKRAVANIKARAAQNNETNIYAAADRLMRLIEKKQSR